MPKLDGTHLPERIEQRLADLSSDKAVAKRDLEALLSDEQIAAMNTAWAEQQALRKVKRARDKQEELELGWKSKREIHIEAYEQALRQALDQMLEALQGRMKKDEVRAAKIYLSSYFAARDENKDAYQADLAAKNALKRAHLGQVERKKRNTRDEEVRAMEDAIRAQIRKKMTPDELEQIEMSEEHERAANKGGQRTWTKAGKARK
jgi:hypothetical protein